MSLRLTNFEEIHSAWVRLQFQNRWTKISVVSPQKEQVSTCFMRKSFVAFCLPQKLELEYSELSFSCTERNQYGFIVFKPFYLML